MGGGTDPVPCFAQGASALGIETVKFWDIQAETMSEK